MTKLPEFELSDYQLAFRLSTKLAILLKALVETDRMTGHEIEAAGLAPRAPNMIQKLRPRVEPYGVAIRSHKGLGYWLDPEDKGVALKHLTDYTGKAEQVLHADEGAARIPEENGAH